MDNFYESSFLNGVLMLRGILQKYSEGTNFIFIQKSFKTILHQLDDKRIAFENPL